MRSVYHSDLNILYNIYSLKYAIKCISQAFAEQIPIYMLLILISQRK